VQQLAIILFWFAIALYVGATVLYAYYFLDKRRVLSWYATFLTGAGFICQTASIGLRSISTGGTLLTGPNSLVLAAWTLVLVYFAIEHLIRLKVYGTVLVPISAALLMAAQILGVNGAGHVALSLTEAQQLDNWRVGIHVGVIMLANAGFAVGAAASIVYLLQESQLKHHRASRMLRRLPSLAQTDLIARRTIVFTFPVYTAGLLLGILRAIEVAGTDWWLDPRVVLAGIVWAIFGVYLFLRYRRGISGRQAAWIAIGGMAIVTILAIVARTVPSGFHIFGLGG
jgi:ABC-type transport system involved in cytochrome c biogenesis permease subunit